MTSTIDGIRTSQPIHSFRTEEMTIEEAVDRVGIPEPSQLGAELFDDLLIEQLQKCKILTPEGKIADCRLGDWLSFNVDEQERLTKFMTSEYPVVESNTRQWKISPHSLIEEIKEILEEKKLGFFRGAYIGGMALFRHLGFDYFKKVFSVQYCSDNQKNMTKEVCEAQKKQYPCDRIEIYLPCDKDNKGKVLNEIRSVLGNRATLEIEYRKGKFTASGHDLFMQMALTLDTGVSVIRVLLIEKMQLAYTRNSQEPDLPFCMKYDINIGMRIQSYDVKMKVGDNIISALTHNFEGFEIQDFNDVLNLWYMRMSGMKICRWPWMLEQLKALIGCRCVHIDQILIDKEKIGEIQREIIKHLKTNIAELPMLKLALGLQMCVLMLELFSPSQVNDVMKELADLYANVELPEAHLLQKLMASFREGSCNFEELMAHLAVSALLRNREGSQFGNVVVDSVKEPWSFRWRCVEIDLTLPWRSSWITTLTQYWSKRKKTRECLLELVTGLLSSERPTLAWIMSDSALRQVWRDSLWVEVLQVLLNQREKALDTMAFPLACKLAFWGNDAFLPIFKETVWRITMAAEDRQGTLEFMSNLLNALSEHRNIYKSFADEMSLCVESHRSDGMAEIFTALLAKDSSLAVVIFKAYRLEPIVLEKITIKEAVSIANIWLLKDPRRAYECVRVWLNDEGMAADELLKMACTAMTCCSESNRLSGIKEIYSLFAAVIKRSKFELNMDQIQSLWSCYRSLTECQYEKEAMTLRQLLSNAGLYLPYKVKKTPELIFAIEEMYESLIAGEKELDDGDFRNSEEAHLLPSALFMPIASGLPLEEHSGNLLQLQSAVKEFSDFRYPIHKSLDIVLNNSYRNFFRDRPLEYIRVCQFCIALTVDVWNDARYQKDCLEILPKILHACYEVSYVPILQALEAFIEIAAPSDIIHRCLKILSADCPFEEEDDFDEYLQKAALYLYSEEVKADWELWNTLFANMWINADTFMYVYQEIFEKRIQNQKLSLAGDIVLSIPLQEDEALDSMAKVWLTTFDTLTTSGNSKKEITPKLCEQAVTIFEKLKMPLFGNDGIKLDTVLKYGGRETHKKLWNLFHLPDNPLTKLELKTYSKFFKYGSETLLKEIVDLYRDLPWLERVSKIPESKEQNICALNFLNAGIQNLPRYDNLWRYVLMCRCCWAKQLPLGGELETALDKKLAPLCLKYLETSNDNSQELKYFFSIYKNIHTVVLSKRDSTIFWQLILKNTDERIEETFAERLLFLVVDLEAIHEPSRHFGEFSSFVDKSNSAFFVILGILGNNIVSLMEKKKRNDVKNLQIFKWFNFFVDRADINKSLCTLHWMDEFIKEHSKYKDILKRLYWQLLHNMVIISEGHIRGIHAKILSGCEAFLSKFDARNLENDDLSGIFSVFEAMLDYIKVESSNDLWTNLKNRKDKLRISFDKHIKAADKKVAYQQANAFVKVLKDAFIQLSERCAEVFKRT